MNPPPSTYPGPWTPPSLTPHGLRDLVLRPGRPFSGAELASMVADGILCRVLLDAHVPAGVPLDRSTRLRVCGALIPPHLQRRGVLGRLGAAWLYDCAPPPVTLPVLVDKDARTTTTLPPGFSLHQTAFNPYDRVRTGGLLVTSPLRTALDLALHVITPQADQALHHLMAAPHLHCPPELVLTALELMSKKPGRRTALARTRKVARAVERGYEVMWR